MSAETRVHEQAVIGGILIDPDAWDRISDKLAPADFFDPRHRQIWTAYALLAGQGNPLDLVTVSETMERDGTLHRAGGMPYLATLRRDTPTAANIDHWALMVRGDSIRRTIRAEMQRLAETVDSEADPYALLDQAQARLADLAQRGAGRGPAAIAELLPAWLDQLDQRHATGGAMIGLTTGLRDLDALTGGLKAGGLYILAGRPGMGKTALALCMARAAAETGAAVAVESLEMPADQLLTRLMAGYTHIDSQRLERGDVDDSGWSKITRATEAAHLLPLYIDDPSVLTLTDLRSRARQLHRQHGIGLLIIDYLQLMQAPGENRVQQIGAISRGLKAIAKELAIPVLALASLNRGLESRHDKRPLMSDLRESGDIESDADLVMMIYRDEMYDDDTPDRGCAEIIIRKQRGGSIGRIAVKFDGPSCRFVDLAGGLPSWNAPRKRYAEDDL